MKLIEMPICLTSIAICLPNCQKDIGPVADDNVYRSIRLFETGVLDAEETVKRLKTELLHDQWTFHTDLMLSFLKFLDYTEVHEEV